ncbi:MAG TPA: hypothetical protein PLG90_03035 [Ignavibacteria bacterium]|nr:hypothetical protein [Ignavibacteria bacterium]
MEREPKLWVTPVQKNYGIIIWGVIIYFVLVIFMLSFMNIHLDERTHKARISIEQKLDLLFIITPPAEDLNEQFFTERTSSNNF